MRRDNNKTAGNEVNIPQVTCPSCNKPNSKWRKFCQHCKKKLTTEQPAF